MNFTIDFRKGGSHKHKRLYIMNFISVLMVLLHHFGK